MNTSEDKPGGKPEIKRNGNIGSINVNGDVYSFGTFALTSSTDEWTTLMSSTAQQGWESDPQIVAGKKIVPYGASNNLPVEIRNIMDANNLAPGILEREIGLLWGQGPELYLTVIDKDTGDVRRSWTYNQEIADWLKSINYKRFLHMAMTEYKHLKGFFVKRTVSRGMRIGRKPAIAKMEVVPACDARLAWVDTGRLDDVKEIYEGDFEYNCKNGVKTIPVYDHADPWAIPVSMSYHNSYSFCQRFYSKPGFYGSLAWIQRSSDVPELIKYLTNNGLSASYHIHSPQVYWDMKEENLRKKYPAKDDDWIRGKMEEIKDEIFKKISEVLAGKTNAGKFIETVDFWDEAANQVVSWKIEAIEQKVKDFIEAQIRVSEKADSATTSGIGLHPALSNIMVDGKLSSGSEMLYALKLYLASDTAIPEEIITEPIKQAIS